MAIENAQNELWYSTMNLFIEALCWQGHADLMFKSNEESL